MPYYRVCFTKHGRMMCFDEFQAEDDIRAIREAEGHIDEGTAELWCGERRVTTVKSKVESAPA